MKNILWSVFSLAVVGTIFAAGTNQVTATSKPATAQVQATDKLWLDDFAAATRLATTKNRPLFLDFTGSDWCYWCKLMDKQVFEQSEWRTFAASNLVSVIVDFPRDKSKVTPIVAMQNNMLSAKYDIEGYPTFIILSPDGKREIARFGCPGRDVTAKDFIKLVQKRLGN